MVNSNNINSNRVLVVEDQSGDAYPLLDLLKWLGYEVDLATNEDEARRFLDDVKDGKTSYALAIFDVMVAIKDIMELVDIDDDFYEASMKTGVRLCEYARRELGLSSKKLPIICISARDDKELVDELDLLGIQLFSRTPQTAEESIREYLKTTLPRLEHQPD